MSAVLAAELHADPVISIGRGGKLSIDIDRLEEAMRASPHQVDCPLVHRFVPGMYIREIFMPRGTRLTSKVHRTRHPFVITKGRVSVWTEREGMQHFTAPYFGITEPGTRRVLEIHEDTVWITFHPTHLTDLQEIEDKIIMPAEEFRKLNQGKTCLGSL